MLIGDGAGMSTAVGAQYGEFIKLGVAGVAN